jgi:uncharacterized protein YdeI (YjbR/CyaY-like superfamily)
MNVFFFTDQYDFREWLEKNHDTHNELMVGYYKIGSGRASMTYPESLDQALCFGWIDGIRKSIDHESYCIRFTPRKPSSTWSQVNIRKAEAMIQQGLMKASGLEKFEKRKESQTLAYDVEGASIQFPPGIENIFSQNSTAWEFFNMQPPYYQRMIIRWVMSAKLEQTRILRLDKVIEACLNKQRIF